MLRIRRTFTVCTGVLRPQGLAGVDAGVNREAGKRRCPHVEKAGDELSKHWKRKAMDGICQRLDGTIAVFSDAQARSQIAMPAN